MLDRHSGLSGSIGRLAGRPPTSTTTDDADDERDRNEYGNYAPGNRDENETGRLRMDVPASESGPDAEEGDSGSDESDFQSQSVANSCRLAVVTIGCGARR